MKSLLTLLFISLRFLYAQENSNQIRENYVRELHASAVKAEQKLTQNKELFTNVNNQLLQGIAQRQNSTLALSFYCDFAKS